MQAIMHNIIEGIKKNPVINEINRKTIHDSCCMNGISKIHLRNQKVNESKRKWRKKNSYEIYHSICGNISINKLYQFIFRTRKHFKKELFALFKMAYHFEILFFFSIFYFVWKMPATNLFGRSSDNVSTRYCTFKFFSSYLGITVKTKNKTTLE